MYDQAVAGLLAMANLDFGASLVGATTSAIGTASTEKSITAGYIDFDIKLNGYLSNGKRKLSNAYNGIKSEFINTFKTGKKTNRGLSVIGLRNNYREFAKSIGANYLNVKDEEWTKEKNLKYLKGVVSRKDDVIFSGDHDPSK